MQIKLKTVTREIDKWCQRYFLKQDYAVKILKKKEGDSLHLPIDVQLMNEK